MTAFVFLVLVVFVVWAAFGCLALALARMAALSQGEDQP